MSAAGLISRLALRQSLRNSRAFTSSSLLASRFSSSWSRKTYKSTTLGYSRSLLNQQQERGLLLSSKRLYSEGLIKSKGDMRVAIIGQSMFGQEVSQWWCYVCGLYLSYTVPFGFGASFPKYKIWHYLPQVLCAIWHCMPCCGVHTLRSVANETAVVITKEAMPMIICCLGQQSWFPRLCILHDMAFWVTFIKVVSGQTYSRANNIIQCSVHSFLLLALWQALEWAGCFSS